MHILKSFTQKEKVIILALFPYTRRKGTTKMKLSLSPLEQDILKQLWSNKNLKVRQLYDILKQNRSVALTSIAVTLDRLHTRGVVDRNVRKGRGGLQYIYFPKKTKQEFEKSMIDTAVNSIIEKFGSAAISYFEERFEKR